MKKIFIYSILAIVLASSAHAQRCDKFNRYCDADLYDFDYSTQSTFAHLYPGDTVPVKTVLYANKEYHITVCSSYEGEMKWKIVKPIRKTVKTIKTIQRDTVEVYKLNEYDEYIVDEETGDYIIESTEITVDTIWNTARVADEKFIFDNSKNVDWRKHIEKTQRAFVYVTLPMDANPEGECVAVFIGRNHLVKAKFVTKKSSAETY